MNSRKEKIVKLESVCSETCWSISIFRTGDMEKLSEAYYGNLRTDKQILNISREGVWNLSMKEAKICSAIRVEKLVRRVVLFDKFIVLETRCRKGVCSKVMCENRKKIKMSINFKKNWRNKLKIIQQVKQNLSDTGQNEVLSNVWNF